MDSLDAVAPDVLQAVAQRMGVPPDFVTEEDIEDYQQAEAERKRDKIEKLGQAIQKRIDDAIRAREASGIERRWRQDLLQYYGEDVNEVVSTNVAERAAEGQAGPGKSGERSTRSRVVVNITRPKSNAAISRLTDMLLPVDDKNWGIKPTPNPELAAAVRATTTPALTESGQPVLDESGQPVMAASAAKHVMAEAKKAAEAMERQIDDNHVECDYNGEQRKMLWFAIVLGTGVIKGPVAMTTVKNSWQKVNGRWAMQQVKKVSPGSKNVDPRNFYPDPSCDGDVRKARYVVEKELFNSKTLRQLMGQEGFIDDAIVECLNEKPKLGAGSGSNLAERRYIAGEYQTSDGEYYEVYHVHGEWTKGELEELGVDGCKCKDDKEREQAISGCVVQCNGRPIKAYLNPLDSGAIPYDVFVYEKVAGQVFGVGIPYILRNPQRVVTAAWRMVLDNASLASGGQIVVNSKVIRPADNVWEVRGTKLWYANEEVGDIRQAFATFQFQTRMEELLKIIEWAGKFSEDESSMPALMEGNQGAAPDTVGGMTLLMNNANTVLRRLVKMYDDQITDPHVSRYYDWHMTYNEDESIKGDYQIDARGSSVLLIRDIQKQSLIQIGNYVVAPQFAPFHKRGGYDWLRTMYEANHIQPDEVLEPDDQIDGILKRIAEQANQQPQDPRIAVAQMKQEFDAFRLKAEQDEAQRQRAHDEKMKTLDVQMKLAEHAAKRGISLEQAKKELAALTIKENAATARQERELNIKARMGTGI